MRGSLGVGGGSCEDSEEATLATDAREVVEVGGREVVVVVRWDRGRRRLWSGSLRSTVEVDPPPVVFPPSSHPPETNFGCSHGDKREMQLFNSPSPLFCTRVSCIDTIGELGALLLTSSIDTVDARRSNVFKSCRIIGEIGRAHG